MLCYKITFQPKRTTQEINNVLQALNEFLKPFHIQLHDYNVETWNDDSVLREAGESDATQLEEHKQFNYISGRFTVTESGKRDQYFKIFKASVYKFSELYHLQVNNVFIQDGQLISENNWVTIS